jgi:hypothetical protein
MEQSMTQSPGSDHDGQSATALCSPIVDLRQYTLYPGTRDEFIDLFDRELVETQEAAGMRVIGQFRDLGDPNRFVWLRGFTDMPAREKALTSFYVHGETWRRFREAANSRMIDSSDALLLHPVRPDRAFALAPSDRRPAPESAAPASVVVATIYQLSKPTDPDFLEYLDGSVLPVIASCGANVLGVFSTEYSPNNFPRLPLRDGENVVITFCGFGDLAAYHAHMTALGRHPAWQNEVYPALVAWLQTRPQVLRLAPTARSQLRA